MQADNEQISASQLTFLLVNAITGIGVLVIPARAAKAAGSAGWLAVLVTGLICTLLVWLIVRLCRKYPDQTIVEISIGLLGKPLGLFSVSILFLLWLATTGFILRTFGEINRDFLLPRTPIEIVMVGTLLTSVYLARKGIEPLARLSMVAYPISVTLGLGVVLLSLIGSDLTNLLPLWGKGLAGIGLGVVNSLFAFMGFEVLLVLMPFLNKPNVALRAGITATLGITALNLLLTVICLAAFGAATVGKMLWPTILVVRNVELPGFFLERVDVFIFSVWLIEIFLLQSIMLYVLSLTLSRIFNVHEQKIFVWPLVPVIYFFSLFPLNISQLATFNTFFSVALMAYVFVQVLLLSLLATRKGGRAGA